MNKAKEISALWSQIKPQIGELVGLCCEVEDHAEVTADAYQRGYEEGLNDAWNAVRKIYSFDLEEREELFHDSERLNVGSICEVYSASEAIEKIRQYEQKQEEQIRVGDEVTTPSGKAVVTGVGPVHFEYVYVDGLHGYDEVKNVKKTGRHFPEIAEVFAKMKETDNG